MVFIKKFPLVQAEMLNTLVFIVPATIYNSGDKSFFVKDYKAELYFDGKWHPVVTANLEDGSISTFHGDHWTTIETAPNLDTVYTVLSNQSVTGRFVFKPIPGQWIDIAGKVARYKIVITDHTGRNFTKEGSVSERRPIPGGFDPRSGITVDIQK